MPSQPFWPSPVWRVGPFANRQPHARREHVAKPLWWIIARRRRRYASSKPAAAAAAAAAAIAVAGIVGAILAAANLEIAAARVAAQEEDHESLLVAVANTLRPPQILTTRREAHELPRVPPPHWRPHVLHRRVPDGGCRQHFPAALGDVTADVEVSCALGNFVLHHLVRFGSDYAPATAAAALLTFGAADTAAEWLPAVEDIVDADAHVPLPPPSIPSPAPGSPYVAAAAPPSAHAARGPADREPRDARVPLAAAARAAAVVAVRDDARPGRVSLYFQDKLTHSEPARRRRLPLEGEPAEDEAPPHLGLRDRPGRGARWRRLRSHRRPSVQPQVSPPRAAAAGIAAAATAKVDAERRLVDGERDGGEGLSRGGRVGGGGRGGALRGRPQKQRDVALEQAAAGPAPGRRARRLGPRHRRDRRARGDSRPPGSGQRQCGDGGGIDAEESITFECPRPKSRSSREPSKKSGLSMADAADHFARADTDGDGVITQKELAAYATEVAEEARAAR